MVRGVCPCACQRLMSSGLLVWGGWCGTVVGLRCYGLAIVQVDPLLCRGKVVDGFMVACGR